MKDIIVASTESFSQKALFFLNWSLLAKWPYSVEKFYMHYKNFTCSKSGIPDNFSSLSSISVFQYPPIRLALNRLSYLKKKKKKKKG